MTVGEARRRLGEVIDGHPRRDDAMPLLPDDRPYL
jgi:hypothetical protein